MSPALLLAVALTAAGPSYLNHPSQSPFMQALRQWKGGFQDAKVGQWVTYELRSTDGEVGYWRFAVVGEAKDPKGRDSIWIEFELGEHAKLRAPSAQLRMLVARESGLRPEGISRMFVAIGTSKPKEIDPSALPRVFAQPSREGVIPSPIKPNVDPSAVDAKEGAPQRLMTYAGTLTASPLELRYKSVVLQRYWLSDQIPLLHLAKVEVPQIKAAMEVRDFGQNARSLMVLPGPNEPKLTGEFFDPPRLDDGYEDPLPDGGSPGENDAPGTTR